MQVGPLPVHLYAIVETLEVWSHSDMTGTFDTISITAPNALNMTVAVRCCSTEHDMLLGCTVRRRFPVWLIQVDKLTRHAGASYRLRKEHFR